MLKKDQNILLFQQNACLNMNIIQMWVILMVEEVSMNWYEVCIRPIWIPYYGIYWVSWYLFNPAELAPSFSPLEVALATFHLPNGATAWETPPSLRICENPLILMEIGVGDKHRLNNVLRFEEHRQKYRR